MRDPGRISRTEIAGQSAELLPVREALALINITNITAVNLAIAVNAASVGSNATAVALQHVAAFQR